jgi:DNA-binding transcriptional MerR regulator
MNQLRQLATSNPTWSLDDLVAVVNDLLPQFLPDEKSHTRVREEVSPRLIRHYTSTGLLDEPLKEGREARYIYRHLLQVLLVRRLLAEGYGASAIDQLARSHTNEELEALLQGGAQLTITPANPALSFLQDIQKRQSPTLREPASPTYLAAPSPPPSLSPPSPSEWLRLELLPGLELHIRRDFIYPRSSQEQQTLLQHIARTLQSFASSRKKPK